MMTNIDWINAVVGKPWVDRADGPNQFDCWGLVVDSYRRIDGVELPEVQGYSSGEAIEQIGAPVRDSLAWPEIKSPQDGCVFCVCLSNGDMVHVGRVLNIHKAGLHALHAAGKDGKGQVAAEPIRQLIDRYDSRLKFYMGPTNG